MAVLESLTSGALVLGVASDGPAEVVSMSGGTATQQSN